MSGWNLPPGVSVNDEHINPSDVKRPAQTTPAYVCKRVRQILRNQGWPMFKLTGRYHPFANNQTGTEGYNVHKVGCSKEVAIHYSAAYGAGRSKDLPHGFAHAKEAEARKLLESMGYRFNQTGWIECDYHDSWD